MDYFIIQLFSDGEKGESYGAEFEPSSPTSRSCLFREVLVFVQCLGTFAENGAIRSHTTVRPKEEVVDLRHTCCSGLVVSLKNLKASLSLLYGLGSLGG